MMIDLMLELFYQSCLVVPLLLTSFYGGMIAFAFIAFAFVCLRRFFIV